MKYGQEWGGDGEIIAVWVQVREGSGRLLRGAALGLSHVEKRIPTGARVLGMPCRALLWPQPMRQTGLPKVQRLDNASM